MRIAFNAGILRAPRTGIGQYVAELANALRADSELCLELFDGWGWQQQLPSSAMPGYSRLSSLVKRVLPDAYTLRRRLQQKRFNEGVRRLNPALYHDPSLWPFEFDGPMVMTMHDLTHVHFPETQPKDRLVEIERHAAHSVERAQRILVDSDFIGAEVCRFYGVAADRVTVAPLGCAARFHPRSVEQLTAPLQALGLYPGEYLLCVGTVEPRKNLQLALRAFEQLPAAVRSRYPLVIVGMPGWRTEQLAAPLQRAIVSGQVRLLGYQSDLAVAELLAGARLLVFPSLYEGFGLPVLEAMASGTPVLLTRSSALPEVAGEAGTYIDAQNEQVCAAAMLRLIDDQAYWQQQRDAGLLRAQAFSWQRCAQITARVYRQVVES
ncbi:alpha-1,3-rhamnosyl/mannosyltransferase [Pseudomonas pohangensis]|uniref:Alpha-1,3-rhamnosyl/mannosyltransferase n=1 Tax=Pseudomonas pohangensis TaxID=364197 RepID=A0A1H2HRX5_9PSED|nr:glycosyltransferase family 1 protein [Pseudomonas pohangensis]SDU34258.1 alpha-1,3-rhamnosyl/mannosyltransferase [Pseudomonas pohangensis]